MQFMVVQVPAHKDHKGFNSTASILNAKSTLSNLTLTFSLPTPMLRFIDHTILESSFGNYTFKQPKSFFLLKFHYPQQFARKSNQTSFFGNQILLLDQNQSAKV